MPNPDRRARKWSLRDLITDWQTGKLRETLIWSNTGKAAMLYGFMYQLYHDQLTEWYAGIFVGAVIFHELTSRLVSQREHAADQEVQKP